MSLLYFVLLILASMYVLDYALFMLPKHIHRLLEMAFDDTLDVPECDIQHHSQ